MIPKQLQIKEARFIRISNKSKIPVDTDWQKSNNCEFDDKRIIEWINKGNNYGVACGYGNILVVDADTEELINEIEKTEYANTFTVKTGSGGRHYYYIIKGGFDKTHPLMQGDQNIGHIRWQGGQVVGPGSTHPNGNRYEVIKNIPLKEMNSDEIKIELNKYIQPNHITNVNDLIEGVQTGSRNEAAFTYSRFLLRYSKLDDAAIKFELRRWNMNNIPPLDENELMRTLQSAKNFTAAKIQKSEPEKKILPVVEVQTVTELLNTADEETDWIIDGFITTDSLNVFGGKTSSHKTWISLKMAYAVATGTPFLGEFNVKEKRGVLFIDEENGSSLIKKRIKLLGMNPVENLYITNILGMKLDDNAWLDALNSFLTKHPDIRLIIVDTYRRVVGYDENEAGAVSEFINKLKQFKKVHNVAFVFTHHFRKSPTNGHTTADDLEEFRGSSDFTNSAETIVMVKTMDKKRTTLLLSCLKLRAGVAFPDKLYKIDSSDGKFRIDFMKNMEKASNKAETLANDLLEFFKDKEKNDVYTKDINDAMIKLGYSETSIKTALKGLEKIGVLENPKKGVWKNGRSQRDLLNNADGEI